MHGNLASITATMPETGSVGSGTPRKCGMTRRSLVAGAASAVMALALLAGCGATPKATDAGSAPKTAEDTSAAATSKLIVGFDQAYPPYGYVGDDGEYTGFDLDLARAVADELDWEVQLEAIDWEAKDALMDSGAINCIWNGFEYTGFDLDLARAVADELDWEVQLEAIDWEAKDALMDSGAINCIWNGFTMEGREDDYTFSDPYMLNAQVIVVRADDGIAAQADLAGKTVVTQIDSAAEEVLEGDAADLAATFASLETIGEYNTAFMQLDTTPRSCSSSRAPWMPWPAICPLPAIRCPQSPMRISCSTSISPRRTTPSASRRATPPRPRR